MIIINIRDNNRIINRNNNKIAPSFKEVLIDLIISIIIIKVLNKIGKEYNDSNISDYRTVLDKLKEL